MHSILIIIEINAEYAPTPNLPGLRGEEFEFGNYEF